MRRALALAATVRTTTAPNPWVGCVVVSGGRWYEGATEPPGDPTPKWWPWPPPATEPPAPPCTRRSNPVPTRA